MAVGSSSTSFQNGTAWVQVNYDDVAMNMVSVVYQNATPLRAIVDIAEGSHSDQFVVLPGAGVPNPITQAIPKNRYTYGINPKDGGIAPNFSTQVNFQA